MDADRARLATAARRRGYPDGDEILDALLAYRDALVEAGRRLNLTAARRPEDVLEVVVLSALSVVCAVERAPRVVIDLGTGNGMPGLAAALAWPAARVHLLERRRRKAEAVATLVEALGCTRVDVLCADAAALLRMRPALQEAVDLVTVRAVGTLAETTRLAAPWLAPGGRIAHWKGERLASAELDAGEAAATACGLHVLPLQHFDDDVGPRRLVIYERRNA